ncbi:MAG TPA: phosphoesterase [Clostridiales bacterium]|nr:phosphoesterase [Clostridiales bacterium]HCV69440.1 phosphoesterase [Clostridiales bacterium]
MQDAGRRFPASVAFGGKMRKKHWWILPALAILVILALIALDERLTLRTYTVVSPKLTAEVRLAVVTDFHSSDNADDVVAMVASCAPDAVLLVGDLFDDDTANRPPERTLSLMRQLSAQYPCYYVSGNHEAWTGEMDALYQQTEEAGVTVLRMSSGVLTVRGQRIALCGIPDPYEMVFSGAPDTEEQIRQAMENVDSADFTVLLTHRPELLAKYAQFPLDLVVSGHAHGGQVRIPGVLNGLYAPNQGWFPKLAGGAYTQDGTTLIVSRGLAVRTRLPRIFNRPEVVLVRCLPAE